MFDAGNYLIEDGLLRFAECGFGEEFEVLGVMVSMEKKDQFIVYALVGADLLLSSARPWLVWGNH